MLLPCVGTPFSSYEDALRVFLVNFLKHFLWMEGAAELSCRFIHPEYSSINIAKVIANIAKK